MEFKNILIAIFVSMLSLGASVVPCAAQIDDDLRDVFEAMLDELEDDIRENFEEAIKKNSSDVEFTPDEFRRFKANPVNPFEGIEDIDPDSLDGNIILKFELPSLRNRSKNRSERQHPDLLRKLAPSVGSAAASTVSVKSAERKVAIGVVVKKNGFVLTKASELKDRNDVTCTWGNGRTLKATVVRVDKTNDIALLKVEANNLPFASFKEKGTMLGAFLLTPDPTGRVLTMGSMSAQTRSTVSGNQAFLDVSPIAKENGIMIQRVTRSGAAGKAGLIDNDIITRFDGVVMKSVQDLVRQIRSHRPGDRVEVEYLRGGTARKATASLSGHEISGEQAAEFKMMNRLGALPSRRNANFPAVFQHDSPLFPEQCGGPIVDLDGDIVGVNIARSGRASSYAIPSSHMKTILADLLSDNVADNGQSRK